MAVSSDVGTKLLAWFVAGTGTLLAYSAVKNRKPWDVLRDIQGDQFAKPTVTDTTEQDYQNGTAVGSIARLRKIANREMPPTLVNIQPCGQLDADAASSKARIDSKLGFVVSASSCLDAYRPYQLQAQSHANNPRRYADPNKSLHVVGLAFDINAQYMNATVLEAFRKEGWHQTRPIDEPWHWSYGVRG